MKKLLTIALSALLISSAYSAAAMQMDLPEPNGEAAAAESDAALDEIKSIPAANVKPGVNMYTGTAYALTFSDAADLDYFTTSNAALSLDSGRLKLIPSTTITGMTLSTALEAATDGRPVAYNAYLYGYFVWGNIANPLDASIAFGSPAGEDSKTIATNNAAAAGSFNAVKWYWNGYGGYTMLMDNVSVVPYYKATYHVSDTETVDTYFLNESGNLSVGADGALSGIPTTYTPDGSIVPTSPKGEFLGWATTENAAAPETSIALAGADLDLYPVYLTPGANLLTGSDSVVDFSVASALNGVTVSGDWGYVSKSTSGASLKLTNTYVDVLTGVTATIPLGTTVTRPVAFYANVGYSGAWGSVSVGGVSASYSSYGGGATASDITKGNNAAGEASADAVSISFGSYAGCYATVGDLAVVPYYKVTYHFSDSTTESVYFLSEDGNIGVSGGKITGVPASYTVDPAIVDTDTSKEFLGWSTVENGAAPMASVALEGSDIDLYPVFMTPGVNLLTGSDSVVDFSVASALNGVTVSGDWGYVKKSAAGTALKLTNSYSDVLTGVTATIPLGTTVTRPVAFYANVGYSGAWGSVSVGGVSASYSSYGGGATASDITKGNNAAGEASADAVSISFGSYAGCYATVTDLAVVPYYKATYHYSDSTTESVYFLSEDGNIGVYAGSISGISTSYTVDPAKTDSKANSTFLGWATAADASVAETTVALDGSDIDLYPVFKADPVETINKISLRVTGKPGIRFAAYIDEENRAAADEYGFITAVSNDTLAAHPEYLTHNAAGDAKGTNENGIRYTSGVNYNKADGTDFVYATDGAVFGDAREGYFFTGVLINIPAANVKTDFITRPYALIDDIYVYGAAMTRSLYDAAEAVKDGGYAGLDDDGKAYIDGILAD